MTLALDLSGRRALITGAGQHIGRAIARALAQAGAECFVNDIVSERAGAVADEIRSAGGERSALCLRRHRLRGGQPGGEARRRRTSW